MGELQDQNRDLSTKLRESSMGLSGGGALNDSNNNQYKESTRDLMFQLQHDLQDHMKALREKETKEPQWNQSEMVHLIKSTVQSALVPVVEQMVCLIPRFGSFFIFFCFFLESMSGGKPRETTVCSLCRRSKNGKW